jgi:hypothetical protein
MRTIVIAAITVALCGSARAESAPSIAPSGVAVQLGGGLTRFARKEATELFHTGGYWDLRAIWGTSSLLGAEASYRATTNNARGGLMGDAQLLGDGAEVAARINVPIELEGLRLTPFAFVGVGWTYYQVIEAPSSWPGNGRHAGALMLPCGAGLSGVIDHIVLDLRMTYRGAPAGELSTSDAHPVQLQSWSAGLTLGYEI